ncbi:MAG: hypothetical protein R3D58_07030 [Saprospiraceae bacterium]|nr:hypothetical protein [Lewinellaceae bacterium]
MNSDVLDMLKTGKVPYRYEYDTASAVYFGLAVLAVILVFTIAQAITRKLIG